MNEEEKKEFEAMREVLDNAFKIVRQHNLLSTATDLQRRETLNRLLDWLNTQALPIIEKHKGPGMIGLPPSTDLFLSHHVEKLPRVENVPSTCGLDDWCYANDDWNYVTCPKCLDLRPIPVLIEVHGGLVTTVKTTKPKMIKPIIQDWDGIDDEEEIREAEEEYQNLIKGMTDVY